MHYVESCPHESGEHGAFKSVCGWSMAKGQSPWQGFCLSCWFPNNIDYPKDEPLPPGKDHCMDKSIIKEIYTYVSEFLSLMTSLFPPQWSFMYLNIS